MRSRAPAFRVGLAGVALAIALAGCGSSDGPPGGAVGSACKERSDCPSGQTCRDGFCTVPSGSTGVVHARFFPPNSSAYLPQSARQLRLRRGRALDVALEPTVVARGSLQVSGGAQETPAGRMVFSRSARPRPDRVRPPFQSTSSPLESGNRFRVSLLQGFYDVRFAPGGRAGDAQDPYPPVIWKNRRIVSGGESNFEVPSPGELVTITGRLSYTPTSASENASVGLPAARVVAVGAGGSARRTTTDVTPEDATTAAPFSLRALPSERPVPYDLLVGPSAENRFIPRQRIPFEELETTGGSNGFRVASDTVTLANYNIGTFPRVDPDNPPELSIRIRPPDSVDAEDVNWSLFRVVLEATALDAGTFVRTGTPDDEGRLAVGVLPVEYAGWILPPPSSPLRARRFAVDVTQDGSATTKTVPLRTKLTVDGRVVSASGKPVPGAEVSFTMLPGKSPTGTVDASRHLQSRRTTSTRTGGDGTFEVRLEKTDYRALVRPPSETGLPRAAKRVRRGRLTGERPIRLQLGEPLLVHGHVYGRLRTEDGTRSDPLSGTRVEFHAIRFGVDTILGSTRAADGGEFWAVLPAPQ